MTLPMINTTKQTQAFPLSPGKAKRSTEEDFQIFLCDRTCVIKEQIILPFTFPQAFPYEHAVFIHSSTLESKKEVGMKEKGIKKIRKK